MRTRASPSPSRKSPDQWLTPTPRSRTALLIKRSTPGALMAADADRQDGPMNAWPVDPDARVPGEFGGKKTTFSVREAYAIVYNELCRREDAARKQMYD